MPQDQEQSLTKTCSATLMTYPRATIYLIADGALRAVAWAVLEHVRVTREFLNDLNAYLRQLSSG